MWQFDLVMYKVTTLSTEMYEANIVYSTVMYEAAICLLYCNVQGYHIVYCNVRG